MDTPEAHPPEHVIWTGRRSQWYYLGYWVIGLAIVALLAAAIYYYRAELTQWMPWIYGAPLIALFATIIVVAAARSQRRYRVTNRRVISELGWMVKDTNEIRIQDIRSMNVSKAGFTGLLGIGKVEFSSAATDDADVIFYQIGGADAVRDMVRKLQN